jgi:hypothetical protein
MSTLRQAIQAKIDKTTADLETLKAELTQAEATYTDWIDAEWDTFKAKAEAFAALVTSHL